MEAYAHDLTNLMSTFTQHDRMAKGKKLQIDAATVNPSSLKIGLARLPLPVVLNWRPFLIACPGSQFMLELLIYNVF